jgi:tetratricopeptide (TPR) repeat protein
MIRVSYDRDWLGAEKEFQRAFELNRSYATAYHGYGLAYLVPQRHFDDAVREMKLARELDPLSLVINSNLGDTFYPTRQYDQAIEQCRKTLELDPVFGPARSVLGRAYEQKGMYPEAIEQFQKAIAVLAVGTQPLAQLGHAYALSGNRVEALKVLDQLAELSKRSFVSSWDMGTVYVGLGDKEHALAGLEKAYQVHSFALNYAGVDPRFDPLHSDPRFTELLRRLGLPP